MTRRLPIAVLLGVLAAPSVPDGALAATAPCTSDATSPVCRVWTAKVTEVNDGDTIDVDVDGDGRRHIDHVRFTGVQAMEQTRYSVTPGKRRGQCHALEATSLVEHLMRLGHHRVRLAAQKPATDRVGRLIRSVAVRAGGRWRDVGEAEMARGVTLWMHNSTETAWNRRYNLLGQRAASEHIGLWNTTTCGAGPNQDAQLKVWVLSDPVGDDARDVNAEYMRVQNRGAAPLALGNWWIRDSGLRRFTFPVGTVLGPGHTITVRSGRGSSAGETFYWGLPGTVFENSVNGSGAGDGAFLFDPQGDLRSWMNYPCLVACSDPAQGAVRVTANAIRGPEYVLVRNVSDHAIDLFGYELRLPGAYGFPPDSVLQPGETMQVDVEGDPARDTRLVKHIGYGGAYLPDSGGTAAVTTFDEIVLGCDSWGSGPMSRCSQ